MSSVREPTCPRKRGAWHPKRVTNLVNALNFVGSAMRTLQLASAPENGSEIDLIARVLRLRFSPWPNRVKAFADSCRLSA